MNTHSLFGYLFIALFSLLVVSCYSTPDGVMSSLSQAEKIMGQAEITVHLLKLKILKC